MSWSSAAAWSGPRSRASSPMAGEAVALVEASHLAAGASGAAPGRLNPSLTGSIGGAVFDLHLAETAATQSTSRGFGRAPGWTRSIACPACCFPGLMRRRWPPSRNCAGPCGPLAFPRNGVAPRHVTGHGAAAQPGCVISGMDSGRRHCQCQAAYRCPGPGGRAGGSVDPPELARAPPIRRRGSRVTGVTNGSEEIHAAATVVAAGAWASAVLRTAGVAIETTPVRGQVIAVRPPAGWVTHMIVGEAASLVPRVDGSVQIRSASEHAGFDTRPTLAAVEGEIAGAQYLMPGLDGFPFAGAWAGLPGL